MAARSNKNPTGFFLSNQTESFEYQGRQEDATSRVANCLSRAFDAIGASSYTQQMVYWKLSTARMIGPNDILRRPGEFMDGIREIYGEAGTVVFEYMLTREIVREFGLGSELGTGAKARDILGLLQLVARSEPA